MLQSGGTVGCADREMRPPPKPPPPPPYALRPPPKPPPSLRDAPYPRAPLTPRAQGRGADPELVDVARIRALCADSSPEVKATGCAFRAGGASTAWWDRRRS